MRQGLLYPGCGMKLGYEAGYGNPLDRVFMRVFPWWECVLDADVASAFPDSPSVNAALRTILGAARNLSERS